MHAYEPALRDLAATVDIQCEQVLYVWLVSGCFCPRRVGAIDAERQQS